MSRVVHLTTVHSAQDNRISNKECKALAEAGHHVILLAPAPAPADARPFRVVPMRRWRSRALRATLGAALATVRVLSLRAEVVHFHDPELIPWMAMVSRVRPGTVLIYDAHEDLPGQVAGKPYIPVALAGLAKGAFHALERLAGRSFDGIVAATPQIAAKYPSQKVCVVQNFPWLRDFPEPIPMRDDHPRVLVYTGAISQVRGSRLMADLAHALEGSARVVLVGPVAPDSQFVLEEGSVAEYAGRVAPEQVPPLVRDSLVGLSMLEPVPNYLDSQPTKVFEYMAAARPFIASDFPYWKTLFGPFECGLFVSPHDPAALRAAAERLLADEELCQRLGDNGREAIEERFNFESQAAELVALYASLTPAGNHRAR